MVPLNTTLTINPGVTLLNTAPHGSFNNLDILGTLNAQGTVAQPIIMTSASGLPNSWDGIYIAANAVATLSNCVVEYSDIGIEANGAITVERCTIQNNRTGIELNNGVQPVIRYSNIISNTTWGMRNNAALEVDARYNWWGHPSGPRHPAANPNGQGNPVSDLVDFTPWLDALDTGISRTENDYTTLRLNTDGTYTRIYPTGHRVHFNADGTHDYTEDPDGHRMGYTYNADGSTATMTFTFAGETTPRYTWTFNYSAGKLQSITDPANVTTDFTLNNLGQLTQVTFADSTNRRFLYDNNGLLIQRWDEDGNSWRYGYDRYGRVQEHTAPPRGVYNYATGTIEVRSEERTFTPSETGYALINDSPTGAPDNPAPAAPTSDELIARVDFGRGSISGQMNRWGAWQNLSDALGRTITFERDDANRITRRTEPDGDCVEFTYDSLGNRTSSTRMDATQCAGGLAATASRTWLYTYEERFNQLKSKTDPLGNTTTYIYDYEEGVSEAGRVIRIQYPAVVVDGGGTDIPTVHYTYNALGLLATVTDEAGVVTRYTYDAAGRLTQMVENEGGLNLTSVFQNFDAAGRPQTIIGPRNNTYRYTYDTWGRVSTETDPLGVVTQYGYDGRGNIIRTTTDVTADGTSGRNVVTNFGYDVDDRLLSQRTTADTISQSDTYVYDINGNLATYTDSEGQTSRFTYDDANQLTGVSNPLDQTTSFAYTLKGELAQITQANNEVITFSYDDFGNLSSLTPPDRPAHGFSYSPRNETAAYTPPALGSGNTQTTYSYNTLRQLTGFTRPDGQSVSYSYDGAQRLRTITQPRGTTTYSYNAATDQLTTIAAPAGVTLSYGYDNELLTAVTWSGPLNGTVNYGYDSFYRLTSLAVNGANSISYQYDTNSFLTGVGNLTINRLPQSRLLNSTTLGNVSDSYTYDAFGKMTRYQATAGGSVVYDVQYSYDDLDRIAGQTETLGGITTAYAYAYDAVGRLVEVKANGSTIATYTYDGNGNRLTGPGGATGTYDAQDRMTSYGNATYTYTANGELLTKTASGQTATYNYDVFSNLMAVTLPNGTQINYLVDGQDRRIGKRVNGTLVQGWLYGDQLEPIAELDGSGNVISRFVYASKQHAPDFMIKGGVTYRIISDHLGSIQLVINTATGQVVQQMDYDEFGKVTQDTNPGFQPFGFAGGLYDRDTGLVRFGARDYDATVGRWTTKDPMRFNKDGYNLYEYVQGNPQLWIDMNGLESSNPNSWRDGLPVCPLTCKDARNDDWKSEGSNSYHPGAKECFRKTSDKPGNRSGNQCCYDVNDNLITHGPGAGTPDKVSPEVSKWDHYWEDVSPYDDNNWQDYHNSGWAPLNPPGAPENWRGYNGPGSPGYKAPQK